MNVINGCNVNVSVIPNGLEQYMAFIINKNLVFIDSKQLMNSCLEKLVKTLLDNDFKYLSEEFNTKQTKLVKNKKGSILMNTRTVLKDFLKINYLIKKHFYKSLKNKHTSEKDYLHTVKVWNNFEMKNISDYHDLYLKTDVLLLADVFEKFINRSLEFFKLDPSYYFQFSWIKLG